MEIKMNGDPESQLTLNEAKILINDFKFETENYKIKVVTLDRQIDALKVQLSYDNPNVMPFIKLCPNTEF